ncbi:hypothetical protein [Thalassovita sp.]|uniref:hypothetical protein n=1 Tax=Thalassovita sp. TaxID=1979401 RepID=UPI0029DE728F|nr:hypothetical protein [Thalassovita sp.]
MAKGLLERLLVDGQQAEAVQTLLNARFGPSAAEIDETLKSGADSLVLKGRFKGQPAVFKRFLTPEAARTISRMQEELSFLSEHLTDRFRANRLLAAVPDQGLAVLELAQGERVSLIFKSDDAVRRAQVLALCGQWLSATAALRNEPRKLGTRRLERQFTDLSLEMLVPEDRALAQRVMDAARGFSRSFAGMQAVHAIAHGDFAPVNMVSDGETVCAVDIQGAAWFPLARTVARFLVAKDLYSQRAAPRLWGVDADDMAAFNPAEILPGVEMTTALPYFIAQQMVRRFVTTYRDRGGHPAARSRLQSCLQSLESA